MAKHKNDGDCLQCLLIFDRYSFNLELKLWFLDVQKKVPQAHISCAGRGEVEQEAAFIRKASKARWGKSAHNYGAAIDIFEMGGADPKDIYESNWFRTVLGPLIPDWLLWYGRPNAPFFELPHVEVKEWRKMVAEKKLKLVE